MQLAAYNNTISGDLFGLTLLLIIFAVLFASMTYTRSKSALQVSLFVSTMLGFLLLVPGIVGLWVPMVFLIGLIASIMVLFKDGGDFGGV